MDTKKLTDRLDVKVLLSTLWIFLSVNYILCDVLSNMEQSALKGLLAGAIEGIPMTQGFLLIAGISLEIPFLMILLSRVLKDKANKIVNIVAAIVMIVYQIGSFGMGSAPTLHYIFFSVVEVAALVLVLITAFKWKTAK